jgi:hypothetical protein
MLRKIGVIPFRGNYFFTGENGLKDGKTDSRQLEKAYKYLICLFGFRS